MRPARCEVLLAEENRSGAAAVRPRPAPRGTAFSWQRRLLLLIVAIAALVRCTTLSFQSLWLDEVYTLTEAGRPWGDLFLALFLPQQAYPLYILGMRLWSGLLGTGEVALRLPAALAGLATVPLLYLLGRRLFDRRTGLLAALLMALSPPAVWYSQEARPYAFVLLLSTLAWLLLWEADERPARRTWWALGLVALLFLLTHRLAAVLSLVGQLLYLTYRAYGGRFARHRRLLVGLLLLILLAAVVGLWFALGATGAERQFGAERDWSTPLQTFTQFSLRLSPFPPEPGQGPDRRDWLLPFALVALAGLVSLLLDLRERGRVRRRAVLLLLFFLAPPGAFFLLYAIRPFYHERYLLPALPAYLLLLAVGISSLWKGAGRLAGNAPRLPFALGALPLAFALFLPLASWRQVQDWSLSAVPSKEQFREATAYLQRHLHPDDLVIVHPGYILPAVEYYRQNLPRIPLDLHTLGDPSSENYTFRDFEADMDDLTRGRRRAWLLIAPYHAETWDPQRWVLEWFTLNPFLHCGEKYFNGVDLYCVTFNENRREGFPTPAIPLDHTFGGLLRLFGADLEPFAEPLLPGDSLPVVLYVIGERRDLPDLEAVVQVVGADGRVWAEVAGRPLGGFLPTTVWLPGDEFLDFGELLLPEEMPAGGYVVRVGYRLAGSPGDWLRLEDGTRWAMLGEVRVGGWEIGSPVLETTPQARSAQALRLAQPHLHQPDHRLVDRLALAGCQAQEVKDDLVQGATE